MTYSMTTLGFFKSSTNHESYNDKYMTSDARTLGPTTSGPAILDVFLSALPSLGKNLYRGVRALGQS